MDNGAPVSPDYGSRRNAEDLTAGTSSFTQTVMTSGLADSISRRAVIRLLSWFRSVFLADGHGAEFAHDAQHMLRHLTAVWPIT